MKNSLPPSILSNENLRKDPAPDENQPIGLFAQENRYPCADDESTPEHTEPPPYYGPDHPLSRLSFYIKFYDFETAKKLSKP